MTDLDDAKHVSQQGLAAIVWVCFGISTLFVTARLAVRSHNHRSLQTDDTWIILGWFSMLLMSIICMLQSESIWHVAAVEDGSPIHDQAKADWHEEQQARWHFALVYLFWVALWCVKASFLAMFYQVMYPFRVQRVLWYIVTIFVTLAFLGCAISSIFNCEGNPGDYFHAGMCENPGDLHRQRFNILFSTVLDVVSNVAIIALQLSVLPVLSLDRKKKIGLGVIFGLNITVVCVAILRMAQILMDEQIDIVGLDIWSAVEICIALIIGSLPPLHGLLSRLRRKRRAAKRSNASLESDLDMDALYPYGSRSNAVMRIESILMDDAHRNSMREGGIYVQRMFSIHVETQSDMELGAGVGDSSSDAPINSTVDEKSRRQRWWEPWA